MTVLTLDQQIAQCPFWYHQIELAPGVVTPGCDDSAGKLALFDAMGLPKDCTGLRVLDVGTCDGYFAFEMERRGADVTAIDVRSPDQNGFAIAKSILGSRVEYQQANVYDVKPDTYGTFDIILFLGVLYHLRHPMLALDRMRQVSRDTTLMFIDTHGVQFSLYDDDLQEVPGTQGTLPAQCALWQTFTVHESPFVGFSPNVTALNEALYKTQWVGHDVKFFMSRIYTMATPCHNANMEAQIISEGLR